jgi:hydroxymethylglutaryl-CoA synthase
MMNISGLGVYLPHYRLKLEEIAKAWNRSGGRGEKTVPALDEDVVTLGVSAARRALEHAGLSADRLGAVYACSLSSGYTENAVAAQTAYALGLEGPVGCWDLGLSARVVTAAMQSCMDALVAKRIQYGLVIASDTLRAKPGSEAEMTSAAGAAALVLGRDPGIAELTGVASHTTGFIARYDATGNLPVIDDERFVMKHGYLEHLGQAAQALERATALATKTYDRLVLQAPDPKWPARAVSKLGLTPEKLVSAGAQTGYAGCASFLLDLALALEKAQVGERILAISFGPGGSDALALTVRDNKKSAKSVTAQLAEKEYVSYTTYLRYTRQL